VTSALGWILGSTSPVSGAIDVVSVRQQDGTFTCSPFHVKLPVRAATKSHMTVTLSVNGEPVKVPMRLGSAGEAFFIVRNDEEETEQIHTQENISSRKHELVESTVQNEIDSVGLEETNNSVQCSSSSVSFRRSLSTSHLTDSNAEAARALSMRSDDRSMCEPLSQSSSNHPHPVSSCLENTAIAKHHDFTRSRFHSYAEGSALSEINDTMTDVFHDRDSGSEYPPLTKSNLAIAQHDGGTKTQAIGNKLRPDESMEASWKWAWGDLPIKFSDPSIADLHSLTTNVALLKKKRYNQGDNTKKMNETDNDNNVESTTTPGVTESVTHEISDKLQVSQNKAHVGTPLVNSTTSSRPPAVHRSDEAGIGREQATLLGNIAKEDQARHETDNIAGLCEPPPPLHRNTSTATAFEVAAALTSGGSDRILSMCAHILSGEVDAPEGLPRSPAELKELILRYAISEEQFSKTPVDVVTNPNLVVVANDLLIPWRLVHAHLSKLIVQEGDDDNCSGMSCVGSDTRCSEGTGCSDVIHSDKAVVAWAGTNVNAWGLHVDGMTSDIASLSGSKMVPQSIASSENGNNFDEDSEYGLMENLSDRSSFVDNQSSMSKVTDYSPIDVSGELLNGAYGCYFQSHLDEGVDSSEVKLWSKESVNWNSSTDLTKMRFHMFKSFNLGHDDLVPDLLRPYVDASKDKDSSWMSNASELLDRSEASVVETLDSQDLADSSRFDIHPTHAKGVSTDPMRDGTQSSPSVQISRSYESGLNSLLSSSKSLTVPANISGTDMRTSGLTDVATESKELSKISRVSSIDANTKNDVKEKAAVVTEGHRDSCVDILSLENISPDDIRPGPARGDITNNDESETESFYSLNFDDEVDSSVYIENQNTSDGANSVEAITGPDRSRKYLYRKSLVPSQEQLKAMNLVNGQNEITFVVNGEDPVQAHVYVWPPDAKVIVADIEGAVFVPSGGKSFGKLAMSLWGGTSNAKKETHEGLSQLFNDIASNGYHFLYIATTPNASSKDDLLKSQQTSGPALPLGPVFLPPDALIQTFGKERTDLYKAAALRGVRTLFNKDQHNPYHAAFGAHKKDARAFDRCGLPSGRTFLVNERGEITTVTSATKRSFPFMNDLLHEVFPAISDVFSRDHNSAIGKSSSAAEDAYGDFNFWRVPPKLLDL